MSKKDNFRHLVLTTNSDESIRNQLARLSGWKLEESTNNPDMYYLSQGINRIYLSSEENGCVRTLAVSPQDEDNEKAIPLENDILFKLHEDINSALNNGTINVWSTIGISANDIQKLNS